jgi:hypothetical protein
MRRHSVQQLTTDTTLSCDHPVTLGLSLAGTPRLAAVIAVNVCGVYMNVGDAMQSLRHCLHNVCCRPAVAALVCSSGLCRQVQPVAP